VGRRLGVRQRGGLEWGKSAGLSRWQDVGWGCGQQGDVEEGKAWSMSFMEAGCYGPNVCVPHPSHPVCLLKPKLLMRW
jgi:hypothetical protein